MKPQGFSGSRMWRARRQTATRLRIISPAGSRVWKRLPKKSTAGFGVPLIVSVVGIPIQHRNRIQADVDIRAVAQLLAGDGSTRRTCLLLILSRDPDDPTLGAYAFRATFPSENVICIQPSAAATTHLGPQPHRSRNVGLALSGGGSRAIAFHLGCLRALHDLDLLNRVQVISSVSGGSVISAMYAYSSDSFQVFDARVVKAPTSWTPPATSFARCSVRSQSQKY